MCEAAVNVGEVVGPFLRRRGDLIAFWCTGCRCAHMLNTDGNRPSWKFDGNADAPTFSPSVLVSDPGRREYTDEAGRVHPARPARTECHLFVRKGQIQFLADSAHELAGKTVPMVPFPLNYGGWS